MVQQYLLAKAGLDTAENEPAEVSEHEEGAPEPWQRPEKGSGGGQPRRSLPGRPARLPQAGRRTSGAANASGIRFYQTEH